MKFTLESCSSPEDLIYWADIDHFRGADYDGSKVFSVEECTQRCMDDEACHAFTFRTRYVKIVNILIILNYFGR